MAGSLNFRYGENPERRAAFEEWAIANGYAFISRNGTFWFHRNGGDGLYEAYLAGTKFRPSPETPALATQSTGGDLNAD